VPDAVEGDLTALSTSDVPHQASRGSMFSSLRERNYQFYVSGQIISLIGVWMMRVAQDWLVLRLSGSSPMALGIAAALQFLPVLLLSLWAGVLADRLDKRRLLFVLEAGLGSCGLVLGLLDVTHVVVLWHVYVLCFALGCFSAVETPVRQSFVVEMVGKRALTNAIALNAMMFNLARIVGPTIAGVMITMVGTGWVFLVNAVGFLGVITGLLRMDPNRLHRSPPVPAKRGQLLEGLRYVRSRPDLVMVMVLVFCVSTFGMTFYTTLAVMARNVFHRQADAYGLLSAMLALGTLTGAALAARRSTSGLPRRRVMIGGAAAFGALELLAGLMPGFITFGLALIPTGVAVMTFTTTANSTVQLAVSPTMRGRVMGLYMLVFLGGMPLGSPIQGFLAEHFGGRAPLVAGGAVSLAAAVVCGALLAWQRGLPPLIRRHVKHTDRADVLPRVS
jgi:MFS family permease